MGKVKQQRSDTIAKKRRIITAALDCFSETGYVSSTMEDIRVASGASNGSIYHFFKSKEQLATEVYLEGIRDYQKGLLKTLGKLPAKEGVYAIVRYHLTWIGANRRWAQYLFSERHSDFMADSEDAIAQHNKEFYSSLSLWLRTQVLKGKIRRLPSPLYTAIIWGPCQEYARLWIAGYCGNEDVEPAIKELSNATWLALRTNSDEADNKSPISKRRQA